MQRFGSFRLLNAHTATGGGYFWTVHPYGARKRKITNCWYSMLQLHFRGIVSYSARVLYIWESWCGDWTTAVKLDLCSQIASSIVYKLYWLQCNWLCITVWFLTCREHFDFWRLRWFTSVCYYYDVCILQIQADAQFVDFHRFQPAVI